MFPLPRRLNFSDATNFEGSGRNEIEFHNTGLYNLIGPPSYPPPNVGIYEYTRLAEDVGKFKTPTLRNIDVTAPYMHDGSVKSLNEVLDHHSPGGRTLTGLAYQGAGSRNAKKDPLIRGFKISSQERSDLIAFLESLTDEGFCFMTRDSPIRGEARS
jgi:cytochrome c peroxidase